MKLIFEWDQNKAKSNLRTHKISFEESKTIFSDDLILTFSDEYHSVHEETSISIGTSPNSRILLVVHSEMVVDKNRVFIRKISSRNMEQGLIADETLP